MQNLYRSKQNRMIAGVAGGLGEYFGVDAVLLRLLWVLSIFFGGAGLFVYVIAWIVIPAEQEGYAKKQRGLFRQQADMSATESEAETETEAETESEVNVEAEGKNVSASASENSDGEMVQPAKAGEPCCASRGGTGDVSRRRRRNAGILLIALGIIFLADQLFGPIFHYIWPLLLIIIGASLLLYERREVGR